MHAPTDEKLLQEYLQGESASFRALVRRHAGELFQFAMRFTSDTLAAEDVVQETLLQVHQSAIRFDPTRRFKPWLFTIAANKARDYLRRRNRRREVSFEALVTSGDETGRRFIDLLSGEASFPDEALQIDERQRVVRDVVGAMPERLREVLILAYYHAFPYKDIGEILEIPVGTVKSRLHAAVQFFGSRYHEAVVERSKGND